MESSLQNGPAEIAGIPILGQLDNGRFKEVVELWGEEGNIGLGNIRRHRGYLRYRFERNDDYTHTSEAMIAPAVAIMEMGSRICSIQSLVISMMRCMIHVHGVRTHIMIHNSRLFLLRMCFRAR